MPNTSNLSSSSKGDESSKPVKKRQKSSKTSAKETGSKSTDRCEPPVVSSTEGMKGEGERWYELLKEKIGFDVNAKRWMEEHPELAYQNKSELLIRLACEVCLAKDTEYDPENENEEQNNKYIRFDTQRIFALFEVANELIDLSDRKNFVEFICQKGNVQLLEMICQKENKDTKRGKSVDKQYKWTGTFTGYSKLIDLLRYVIDNRCSPEIVLCIAEKMYGSAHVLCNGKQYLDSDQTIRIKGTFSYQDSVVKELLKKAIKLGYKSAVSVMLSGDIYHSIRLMKWEVFQKHQEFLAAYNMIKETVANVISSWVEDKQSCKGDVQNLLDQGIKTDMEKVKKEDLMYQLECLEKEITDKHIASKEKLMKELKKLGKEKGEVRLRPTVVGALISTLFFKHQDEAIKVVKNESFTLKTTLDEKSKKEKKLNELNQKINSGEPINDTVLELIKSLNSCSHMYSNWFFREVLAKVVNEKLDELKAVCTATCKEPMKELLKDEKVHENVIDVLKFVDVEILPNQITTSEIPNSCASVGDHFVRDVNEIHFRKKAKESCSSDELAFSGLTRKIIRDLKEKKDFTDKEKEDLISKAVSEIKKGIDILADGTVANIDAKDIFLGFEFINDEITKEKRKEIVELVCQKGNVQLLEMICQKENKDTKRGKSIDNQYKWTGTFTGYSKLIDLLRYVIDNRCSPEIVLCIAEKMYGSAHVLCNGEQYLDSSQTRRIKESFDYQDLVAKGLIKKAIKLGYKSAVSVMLSGDIYHSIRLMKWEVFQENQEFLAACDMIKETVADVISSWVEDKQSCKDSVQNLLDQGIKIDMEDMSKESIIWQLEYLGKEVINRERFNKEKLMKELKELEKEKGEVRLRTTVVGALISTLFFKHQDEAIKVVKNEPFTLKISSNEKSKKEKKLNELNQKINSGESINGAVLELIQSLNSASHYFNNWFFREVLAKIVNENLDKLKAVCAAICKEPMQELLKGEEVHKNVIDVLQFFGVEKDFLLEKSIPGNSDDALVRNSQGVEETLSNRSEKSISSSSRQSSADHDPQSSTVPISQGGKSIPSAASKKSCSASNLPSSRVAEKNNEGVMQNNCVQGGNPCYSTNTGREFYYLNVRNSSMGVRMPKLNETEGWMRALRSSDRKKTKKLVDAKVPKINDLQAVHRERYKEELLLKILSYNGLIDDPQILQEDSNQEIGELSSDSSFDVSLNASGFSIDRSLQHNVDDVIQNYTKGIMLLKEGQEKKGKEMISEAAKQGFPHAMYAHAIIKFKQVMEGSTTELVQGTGSSAKDEIIEAVNHMISSGKCFFPLNSFVLGVMELYNIGDYGSVIKDISKKSWQVSFADVLLATEGTKFRAGIEASKVLSYIGLGNLGFIKPDDYMAIMENKRGVVDLEWMVKCVEYELARDIVLDKKNSYIARYLLQELSLSGFADAKYSYAIELLKGTFDQLDREKAEQAYKLLYEAVSLGHQEAKLLFGTLPFRKEFDFLRKDSLQNGKDCFRYLKEYVNVTCDNKDLKERDFKEKAASLVASEYLNNSCLYVLYDEEKARSILEKHGCSYELKELDKRLQKRQEQSENLLSDVVKTLRKVRDKSQELIDSGELNVKQLLLSTLEQLPEKLKDSKIIIRESEALSPILKQLNSISSIKKRELLLLQQLCDILEEEVSKKLDNSLQKEILPLLENLSEVCISLQRRRSNSLSSISATKSTSTRRGSAAETLQLQSLDESVSDVFKYPSTPSSKVKEIVIPSSSSQALLSRPRAASTAINFQDDNELEPFVNASEFFNADPGTSTGLSSRNSRMFESSRRLSLFVHDKSSDGKLLGDCFNIAADLCEKGEYRKALDIYEQVFDRRNSVVGYKNFNTIMARHNMAVLFYVLDEPKQALDTFREMLDKLGPSHHYAADIEYNIDVVLKKQGKELFVQPGEKQIEPFSKSVSNNFQSVPIVDKGKSSYGSSLSSSSGFESGFSAFSEQSISERGKIAKLPSSVSGRTEQKQSSGSSQQNVSAAAGLGNGSRRVERLSSFSSTQGRSTSGFSRSSSRTSKSVSDEFSATDISKCTSKGQKVKNKSSDMPPSRSSSRPSSSLDNLETEKHTASSRSIGKR